MIQKLIIASLLNSHPCFQLEENLTLLRWASFSSLSNPVMRTGKKERAENKW